MILSGFRVRITAVGATLLVMNACGVGLPSSDDTTAAKSWPHGPRTTSAPTSTPTAATTPSTELPPATPPPSTPPPSPSATPIDWANFEYPSAECGTLSPITLTNGSFVDRDDDVVVKFGLKATLDSGNTAVVLHCLVGPSGDTGSAELLLFGPDGNELAHESLPPGDPTINLDGTGSLVYDVYAPDDPRCCPSGTETVSFTITDDTILVALP